MWPDLLSACMQGQPVGARQLLYKKVLCCLLQQLQRVRLQAQLTLRLSGCCTTTHCRARVSLTAPCCCG